MAAFATVRVSDRSGRDGEVYLARDTRLNRDVALKVLLPSFVQDPERVARFQREAQVLAALNHPHIAHIYGIPTSGRGPGQTEFRFDLHPDGRRVVVVPAPPTTVTNNLVTLQFGFFDLVSKALAAP